VSAPPTRWSEDMPVPAEHVGHYPPSLSGYTHGNCRCWACRAENTIKRQEQRAGLTSKPRLTFEDRVRQEIGA
jgi:hypothetical protein